MFIFFLKNKIGLVFGVYGCHFIGIDLVSVSHLTENDISSRNGGREGSRDGIVGCKGDGGRDR